MTDSNRTTASGKPKLSLKHYAIILVVGLVYLWLRPHLERWTGMELPGPPREEQVADAENTPADDAIAANEPRTITRADISDDTNSSDELDSKSKSKPDSSANKNQQQTKSVRKPDRVAQKDNKQSSTVAKKANSNRGPPANQQAATKPATTSKKSGGTKTTSTTKSDPARTSTTKNGSSSANRSASTAKRSTNAKQEARLGELRDVGRRVFISTAGLRYTPGSAEGHRIDHVLKHAKDQPNRQGSHGVFDGGREQILTLLDEAYMKIKSGGRGVKKDVQDRGITAYTVDMRRKIGFVGGQSGKRRNNPSARHVKLVLDGDRVITAYPLKP